MINYVNSVISVRCLQITAAGHLDSVSITLFTLINGEPVSRYKVVGGCSSSVDSDRGFCTGGRLIHNPQVTITQRYNHEMKEESYW